MPDPSRDPINPGNPAILNAGNRTYESEFERVTHFEGDDVFGGNIAYGNSPRTNGAIFAKKELKGKVK